MGNFLKRRSINLLTFLISPGSKETYLIRLKTCNRFWFAVCFLKTRAQVNYWQHLTLGVYLWQVWPFWIALCNSWTLAQGSAQITEMCLKKVKWIAVSHWKTPTGVDFLQHLIPGWKHISQMYFKRVQPFWIACIQLLNSDPSWGWTLMSEICW